MYDISYPSNIYILQFKEQAMYAIPYPSNIYKLQFKEQAMQSLAHQTLQIAI